jgi:transglutaminase-like putative cysteine protease
MQLIPQSSDLSFYLQCSEVIDCNNVSIKRTASELSDGIENEIELVKTIYEFVRDKISHSSDIGEKRITYKSSDVLKYKQGLCFAKSHLLAAILRNLDIPTGFCYQKLQFESGHILHGLNAVYFKNLDKWIRLDARGNTNGINAQFSVHEEFLAYSPVKENGDVDYPFIFKEPDFQVVKSLKSSKNLNDAIKKILKQELDIKGG